MSWEMELEENILEDLYLWIDSLPLSRPKKRIERDFSDGTLVAEIIRYYLPDLVEMHNYTPANSFQPKKANWGMLNRKVLSHFGLDLPDVKIAGLANGQPGLIEVLLYNLRLKIDEELELQQKIQQQPNSQHHMITPRQSSLSHMGTISKTNQVPLLSNRSNKSIRSNKTNEISHKEVSRLEYEEIKQQSFQQQEEIEVLHAKIRRLEHVLQLKDIRISELSKAVEDSRPTRPTATNKK
ncbi:unnamed protein product [Adineta steineri]|uniref:Calponin-homology (CH) domain-containing protein n=1 Tax=Adineta steineri TaxID=433720 RepID=A0A814K338_9BILA|nr:unnamed protein product [Adineta steineri]CAF1045546.1 unnamed protein product [Adineta steineri]CAF1077736.1 unnamed protein product [Adineta steineri]CAF1195398.1 unnamed protein product [Adineta steineri]CAF3942288.1 unnamed protein product [Adineta steineri]